eukprot:scaffold8120_cov239-Pinguiococcus_pyrenoidosus.AAC.1
MASSADAAEVAESRRSQRGWGRLAASAPPRRRHKPQAAQNVFGAISIFESDGNELRPRVSRRSLSAKGSAVSRVSGAIKARVGSPSVAAVVNTGLARRHNACTGETRGCRREATHSSDHFSCRHLGCHFRQVPLGPRCRAYRLAQLRGSAFGGKAAKLGLAWRVNGPNDQKRFNFGKCMLWVCKEDPPRCGGRRLGSRPNWVPQPKATPESNIYRRRLIGAPLSTSDLPGFALDVAPVTFEALADSLARLAPRPPRRPAVLAPAGARAS